MEPFRLNNHALIKEQIILMGKAERAEVGGRRKIRGEKGRRGNAGTIFNKKQVQIFSYISMNLRAGGLACESFLLNIHLFVKAKGRVIKILRYLLNGTEL